MSETKEVFGEFRIMFDGGDPWGSTMEWWFTIADELHFRDGFTPAAWKYRPSPLGPTNDPDSLATTICRDLSSENLIRFGNALGRYARLLRAAGRDY